MRPRSISTDLLIGADQIAEYLGVSRSTVYRQINHFGLPAFRLARAYRTSKRLLDDWILVRAMQQAKQKGD